MANPRDVNLDIVGHDKTGRATREAAQNLDKLRRKVDDVNDSNNNLGKVAQKSTKAMSSSFVDAAAQIRSAGPIAAVAALGAGIVALPTLAAAAGIGIVGGLGGAFAAVGIKAALSNKKVQDAFSRTKDHVVSRLKEMAQPFEPVLIRIAKRASDTFDSFAPSLDRSFKKMAPALDRFSVQFFKAIGKLKPMIGPVTDEFVRLADQIGPRLPGIFNSISNAIIDITDALRKNPEAVGRVITGFEGIITATGKTIAWLIRMNQSIALSVSAFQNGVAKIKVFIFSIGVEAQKAFATVLEAGAKLPGPLGSRFRQVAKDARAQADKASAALQSMKTDQSRAQVEMLQAKIRYLKGKKVVTETDKAAIAQAKSQIASLQRNINAFHGKTVNLNVKYNGPATVGGQRVGGGGGSRRGGITAFAGDMTWEPYGGNRSRVGGPSQVLLTNETSVDARVYIDGDSIRAVSRKQVRNQSTNDAWRSRVGTRR